MALLDEVKFELRITTTDTDVESAVQRLIDECKVDLVESGILNIDETDPLIKRAIFLYAKANFGLDDPKADKKQQRYNDFITKLALSDEYQTAGA